MRADNIKIFKDTMNLCSNNKDLVSSIQNFIQKQQIIYEEDKVGIDTLAKSNIDSAEIVVSRRRTFEAASLYKGFRVCVLNFASATNPGGGVESGASAQEECLCRVSTLYKCLNTPNNMKHFYNYHRRKLNNIYNDDCIYTPDIKVFKKDTNNNESLPRDKWFNVDVITCAAPRLSYNKFGATVALTDKELLELHKNRLEKIVRIAVANKEEVLILGAFGCGAFRNNPEVVAKAFKHVIEQYRNYFKIIEFAVYDNGAPKNYNVFNRVFGGRYSNK